MVKTWSRQECGANTIMRCGYADAPALNQREQHVALADSAPCLRDPHHCGCDSPPPVPHGLAKCAGCSVEGSGSSRGKAPGVILEIAALPRCTFYPHQDCRIRDVPLPHAHFRAPSRLLSPVARNEAIENLRHPRASMYNQNCCTRKLTSGTNLVTW